MTRAAAVVGGLAVAQQQQITCDGMQHAQVSLAVPCTNTEVNIDLDFADLKALIITCDQDMTLKTNSSSTPDDTFTIKKNIPLIWSEDCGFDNPVTADVSTAFATIASVDGVSSATLNILAGYDATP